MPDTSFPRAAPGARDPSTFFRSDDGHYCLSACVSRRRLSDTQRGYADAAAAEAAGLRPCPACRPEHVTLPAGTDAAPRRVRRAASMRLALGADETAVAAALGVSRRRLAQDFAAVCGVTPAAHAEAQRRLLALRLLGDTTLPLADVARACAYADIGALEAELAGRYGDSAARLRQSRRPAPARSVTLTLAYAPPYAWARLLGFLAGRAIDGSEEADATTGCYRRTVRAVVADVEYRGWIEASVVNDALALTVADSLLPALPAVLSRAWHAFDLGAAPQAIARRLGGLARGEPGLRLPGTFDPFELVVRAILGQQITVKAARTLASRFVAAFGTPLDTPHASLTRVFPSPAGVAGLPVDAIASLGIIGARTRTILAVADALASGRLALVPGADPDRTIAALKALPGIGEWTAQYVAMRALGARDAFPHTDYGVMKALGEKNAQRLLELGEGWRPYRAYAVMHLWRSLG